MSGHRPAPRSAHLGRSAGAVRRAGRYLLERGSVKTCRQPRFATRRPERSAGFVLLARIPGTELGPGRSSGASRLWFRTSGRSTVRPPDETGQSRGEAGRVARRHRARLPRGGRGTEHPARQRARRELEGLDPPDRVLPGSLPLRLVGLSRALPVRDAARPRRGPGRGPGRRRARVSWTRRGSSGPPSSGGPWACRSRSSSSGGRQTECRRWS